METKKLYNIAESEGITVDFVALPENVALSLKLGDKGFIALDKNLVGRTAAERVALAHELGHLATGALYTPDADPKVVRRSEHMAHRWAINALVPYGELLKAIKSGEENISFLADRFGVTEDFMQSAIKHYCENQPA